MLNAQHHIIDTYTKYSAEILRLEFKELFPHMHMSHEHYVLGRNDNQISTYIEFLIQ